MDKILTTAGLCEFLEIHENTLAAWRKEGLPSYPRGSSLVYKWAEVAAWLRANDREGYVLPLLNDTRTHFDTFAANAFRYADAMMMEREKAVTTLKLYEIPDAIRELELQIIEADGEITPEIETQLDALEEEFERKVEYIALLSREAKAEAVAVKQEEDRLRGRRNAAENREKRLKGYLYDCMIRQGVPRVEGPRAKVRIQKNTIPSIEWKGDEIPEEFRVVDVRPNLALARDTLKAGAALPEGFTATWGQHLRVW